MSDERSILALAGGVGGAKLALGLTRVLAPGELAIVVNTADDFDHMGLHISPDLDSVMYALAGMASEERGWGIEGESWNFMAALDKLGGDIWFNLGDRDLATHVMRTELLRVGMSLSAATGTLAGRLEIKHPIVPMSDDPVRTVVHTDEGRLPFQDYFVGRQCEPAVRSFSFDGADRASPSPGFEAALGNPNLSGIVICPSNPYVSVAPILAIPGIDERMREPGTPVVAVSPIVGGTAIKGPAAKMMRELGHDPSAVGIARHYGKLLDGLVIDRSDAAAVDEIEALGIRTRVAPTVMRSLDDRIALARETLDFVEALGRLGIRGR